MNILSLSRMIPEQICDTVRFFGDAGETRISHYCRYAADFISRVLTDPRIDGAVFPKSCDSCRVIGSYLEGCGKFAHQLHVPARRDEAAVAYFAESLRQYKRAVEAHYGVMLADIPERTVQINARNRALRELYEGLAEVDCAAYLDMLHALLQRPLAEQAVPDSLPGSRNPIGARVLLLGSTLTNVGLARQIEATGMNIVGDRLPESRRLFCAPEVSPEGDIFENIARSALRAFASPTQGAFSNILREDREEIVRKGVRGVIFASQKYCEPYDFLYPAYRKMLDELGVKSLRLTLNGADTAGAPLAIETFADML